MSKTTTTKINTDEMDANVKAEKPRISSFEIIRNWINSNEEVSARCDESFILQYLAISEFDIEKTKKRIVRYNACRRAFPKWFTPIDENVARYYFCEKQTFCNVSFKHFNETSTTIVRLGKLDFHKYTTDQVTHLAVVCGENALEDIRFQVIGIEFILDFDKMNFHTASSLSINFLQKTFNLMQKVAPLKINKVHIINTPKIFRWFLFTGVFITKRIFQETLIINHGHDLKSLHKSISPKYLPFEYEGTAGSFEMFSNEAMELSKHHAYR